MLSVSVETNDDDAEDPDSEAEAKAEEEGTEVGDGAALKGEEEGGAAESVEDGPVEEGSAEEDEALDCAGPVGVTEAGLEVLEASVLDEGLASLLLALALVAKADEAVGGEG